MHRDSTPVRAWSSTIAFYLAAIGAAVGLGSIWRFPYLAGTSGGGAFIFVFVVACSAISIPLLVAEFAVGRRARRAPVEAVGALARHAGRGRRWNAIGWLGTLAAFLISSYYTVIAGWVLAYTWKCATGAVSGTSRAALSGQFRDFLASPVEVGGWHFVFMIAAASISARGLHRGIEVANKVRAPALLILLLILVGYALATGDVQRGLTFAFAPDLSRLSGEVVLAAIGQAFFATGVGTAVMMAYGAYVPAGVSLARSAAVISLSIVVVSLLAALVIFPLVFRYGMDPAQGPELVFEVLPAVFAEMPGGRLVGTLFFTLLVLAAFTPSIALFEPVAAWLEHARGIGRVSAVWITAAASWLVGLGTILSFGAWADWRPLSMIPGLSQMTFFGIVDFASANLLLPIGALLTSIFMGWRVPEHLLEAAMPGERTSVRIICIFLLRYVCPIAILAVLAAALA